MALPSPPPSPPVCVALEARRQQSRSLLDSVMDQVASLQHDLAPGDRRRLTQYLDDVREVERRIQRAEASVRDDLELPEVPSGIPATFQDHLKLLMDLQVTCRGRH